MTGNPKTNQPPHFSAAPCRTFGSAFTALLLRLGGSASGGRLYIDASLFLHQLVGQRSEERAHLLHLFAGLITDVPGVRLLATSLELIEHPLQHRRRGFIRAPEHAVLPCVHPARGDIALSQVFLDQAHQRRLARPHSTGRRGYIDADAKPNERGEFEFTTMDDGDYELGVRSGSFSQPDSTGKRFNKHISYKVRGDFTPEKTYPMYLYSWSKLKPVDPKTVTARQ